MRRTAKASETLTDRQNPHPKARGTAADRILTNPTRFERHPSLAATGSERLKDKGQPEHGPLSYNGSYSKRETP